MKPTAILFLFLLFVGELAVAQKQPQKKALMQAMVLTNDYFMKKWPDVGQVIVSPDRTRPSNIWTRAVYYEGLLALHQLNPKKEYLNYMTTWAEFHRWGLRNGTTTRNGDDQCCGQIYIDLYLMDKKPERIKDIKTTMDNMIATAKAGNWPSGDWTWVDALQMAMPILARLGVVYQDDVYYEKMHQMYAHTKTIEGGNGLYNPATGLWWRDKDFDPPYQTANGKPCYWSRGNGWVLAALVRTLDIMPKNAPHRDEYLKTYLEMVRAIAPLQREDGFWNVNLGDPNDFGGKELTGTSLFVYGMAWGVNQGILDSKTYRPIIAKASQAMIKDCVHANGFLGYVQGTGKEPKDSQPVGYDNIPNFEDFGLGCFLLATTEVYKMKR
jgi:unsaturated rhamnogalacturonyl hydrolase